MGFLGCSQHSLSFALGSYSRTSARHIVKQPFELRRSIPIPPQDVTGCQLETTSTTDIGAPQELAQYPFLFIPTIRHSPGSDGGAKERRRQRRLDTCARTSYFSSRGQSGVVHMSDETFGQEHLD